MKIDIEDLRKIQGIGNKTIDRIYEAFQEKEDTEIENINLDNIPSFTAGDVTIYNGEAIQVMGSLVGKGIMFDAIITDPPYEIVPCAWDSALSFSDMWLQLKLLSKPDTTIALTSSQPFTSALVMSNREMFRYEWIWDKHIARGMHQAKYQPMRKHESILIFSKNYPSKYIPQMVKRDKPVTVKNYKKDGGTVGKYKDNTKSYTYTHKNPVSIITGLWEANGGKLHPTQKPVALMEYLIKTYTNEGETVLDFTFGSGTTAIACINTNRKFVGIELDEGYFNIAKERIQKRLAELEMGL